MIFKFFLCIGVSAVNIFYISLQILENLRLYSPHRIWLLGLIRNQIRASQYLNQHHLLKPVYAAGDETSLTQHGLSFGFSVGKLHIKLSWYASYCLVHEEFWWNVCVESNIWIWHLRYPAWLDSNTLYCICVFIDDFNYHTDKGCLKVHRNKIQRFPDHFYSSLVLFC